MFKCIRTRFRTEPISEQLCLNTQFGYLNIAFNLKYLECHCNKQTFNVGRAYYSQLIKKYFSYFSTKTNVVDTFKNGSFEYIQRNVYIYKLNKRTEEENFQKF